MRHTFMVAAAAEMLAGSAYSQARSAPAAAVPAAPAAPAAASSAPDDLDWLAKPSFEDMAHAFPPEALEKGVSGQTAIRCTIEADGGLADCGLVAETPAGRGFGAASLSLASRFRMRPEAVAKLGAAPRAVTVPMRWSVIATPTWQSQPTGDDLARLFPDQALSQLRSGATKINCRVQIDGRLSDCVVLSETPEGFGFGRAALASARYFRMSPKTSDGKSVEGGVVQIPMRWYVPGGSNILMVGDDAMLITVLKDGAAPIRADAVVFKCALAADPARRCQALKMGWSERPSNAEVRAAMAEHHLSTGKTRLSCVAGDDGRLTDCVANAQATADQEAAMRVLAGRLKADSAFLGGVPLKMGRIILQFDWEELHTAAIGG